MISAKALTVSGISGTSRPYNGSTSDALSGTAALSGYISGDNVTLTGPGVGTLASASAGSEAVTVTGYGITGGDIGDYNFTQPVVANVTIGQESLTITATGQSQTYGFGGLGTTGFSATTGTIYNGDITGVTLSTNDTTSGSGNYNAGTYNLTPSVATGPGLGNYNISYATDTGGLVIAKANQTIIWATPAYIIAGTTLGNTQLDATASGVPGGSAAGGVSYSPGSGTLLNSGLQQPLTATAAATTNYNQATYTVYIDVYPAKTALQIEMLPGQATGIAGRSYIRYVDLLFGSPTGLASLISKVTMSHYDLSGNYVGQVGLGSVLSASGSDLHLDFGANGITGNPSTNAGDGIYDLVIAPAVGPAINYKFFRLLGDVNGDGVVNATDSNLILANYGKNALLAAYASYDVNGDGVINATDRTLATRYVGDALTTLGWNFLNS